MKYHKRVERCPEPEDNTIPAVIAALEAAADGLVDARWGWGCVTGWEPMTEAEREAADLRSARAKKARQAKLDEKRKRDVAAALATLEKYGEGQAVKLPES